MLNMILKNFLQRTSFTSLNPKSVVHQYKGEVSRRRITSGLVKLKLATDIINPQLVVNHAIKEQDLKDLTFVKCGNNDNTYHTTLQEKQNEINANLPGNDEYPIRRFNTNIFIKLEKSTYGDFLTNVKDSKSRWIKCSKRERFGKTTDIGNMSNIYTHYASTGT